MGSWSRSITCSSGDWPRCVAANAACAALPCPVPATLLGLYNLGILAGVFAAEFLSAAAFAISFEQISGGACSHWTVRANPPAKPHSDAADIDLGLRRMPDFSALSQHLRARDRSCDFWHLHCGHDTGSGRP